MNDTITGAVETHRDTGAIVQQVRDYRDEFAQVLPSHINPITFTRLAVGALKRDPKLLQVAQQNPASLMQALLEAARLGLEPGTNEYYLTPRGGRQPGVLGITGYQGEIELIYRAGAVSSVKAEVVCAADTFTYRPGDQIPDHRIDWFSDRGHVLGAYAYAVMRDGATSKVVVVGPKEITRAKAASATADKDHSPWKTDYAAMVLKTAIHQLAKWVPTSAEYRREQLRAVATVAAETEPARGTVVNPGTGEIIDAETVD
jgi:recombination protein RecT